AERLPDGGAARARERNLAGAACGRASRSGWRDVHRGPGREGERRASQGRHQAGVRGGARGGGPLPDRRAQRAIRPGGGRGEGRQCAPHRQRLDQPENGGLMQRQMLKSKIHRATITDCDVDYVGSITLDPELMRQADLLVNEQVHVWDIDNGARFVTYAIEGAQGSGTVQVNGAAARLVRTGDKVIIASFGAFDEKDLERYSPVVVHVNDENEVTAV